MPPRYLFSVLPHAHARVEGSTLIEYAVGILSDVRATTLRVTLTAEGTPIQRRDSMPLSIPLPSLPTRAAAGSTASTRLPESVTHLLSRIHARDREEDGEEQDGPRRGDRRGGIAASPAMAAITEAVPLAFFERPLQALLSCIAQAAPFVVLRAVCNGGPSSALMALRVFLNEDAAQTHAAPAAARLLESAAVPIAVAHMREAALERMRRGALAALREGAEIVVEPRLCREAAVGALDGGDADAMQGRSPTHAPYPAAGNASVEREDMPQALAASLLRDSRTEALTVEQRDAVRSMWRARARFAGASPPPPLGLMLHALELTPSAKASAPPLRGAMLLASPAAGRRAALAALVNLTRLAHDGDADDCRFDAGLGAVEGGLVYRTRCALVVAPPHALAAWERLLPADAVILASLNDPPCVDAYKRRAAVGVPSAPQQEWGVIAGERDIDMAGSDARGDAQGESRGDAQGDAQDESRGATEDWVQLEPTIETLRLGATVVVTPQLLADAIAAEKFALERAGDAAAAWARQNNAAEAARRRAPFLIAPHLSRRATQRLLVGSLASVSLSAVLPLTLVAWDLLVVDDLSGAEPWAALTSLQFSWAWATVLGSPQWRERVGAAPLTQPSASIVAAWSAAFSAPSPDAAAEGAAAIAARAQWFGAIAAASVTLAQPSSPTLQLAPFTVLRSPPVSARPPPAPAPELKTLAELAALFTPRALARVHWGGPITALGPRYTIRSLSLRSQALTSWSALRDRVNEHYDGGNGTIGQRYVAATGFATVDGRSLVDADAGRAFCLAQIARMEAAAAADAPRGALSRSGKGEGDDDGGDDDDGSDEEALVSMPRLSLSRSAAPAPAGSAESTPACPVCAAHFPAIFLTCGHAVCTPCARRLYPPSVWSAKDMSTRARCQVCNATLLQWDCSSVSYTEARVAAAAEATPRERASKQARRTDPAPTPLLHQRVLASLLLALARARAVVSPVERGVRVLVLLPTADAVEDTAAVLRGVLPAHWDVGADWLEYRDACLREDGSTIQERTTRERRSDALRCLARRIAPVPPASVPPTSVSPASVPPASVPPASVPPALPAPSLAPSLAAASLTVASLIRGAASTAPLSAGEGTPPWSSPLAARPATRHRVVILQAGAMLELGRGTTRSTLVDAAVLGAAATDAALAELVTLARTRVPTDAPSLRVYVPVHGAASAASLRALAQYDQRAIAEMRYAWRGALGGDADARHASAAAVLTALRTRYMHSTVRVHTEWAEDSS